MMHYSVTPARPARRNATRPLYRYQRTYRTERRMWIIGLIAAALTGAAAALALASLPAALLTHVAQAYQRATAPLIGHGCTLPDGTTSPVPLYASEEDEFPGTCDEITRNR